MPRSRRSRRFRPTAALKAKGHGLLWRAILGRAVSQENVEFVRRYLARFNATHRLPEDMVSADIVWDLSGFEGWPGQTRFVGIDEFNVFLADWIEAYEEWVHDVEQLRDAGQGRVIAVLVQRGRVRGSSSWVENRYSLCYTLKDGVLVQGQIYKRPEDAFEAVGLRE